MNKLIVVILLCVFSQNVYGECYTKYLPDTHGKLEDLQYRYTIKDIYAVNSNGDNIERVKVIVDGLNCTYWKHLGCSGIRKLVGREKGVWIPLPIVHQRSYNVYTYTNVDVYDEHKSLHRNSPVREKIYSCWKIWNKEFYHTDL